MDQSQPTAQINEQKNLIDMRPNTLIQVVLLGVIVGAVTWLLSLLLDRFILAGLLCGGQTVNGVCASSTSFAGNVALIIASIAGLFGLVRLGIYRPLLIVIASVIALWGITTYVAGLSWYESIAWTVGVTAICYLALSWFVRPRMFLIAIILVLASVTTARILPVIL